MEVVDLVRIMAGREAERFFTRRLMIDTNYLPEERNADSLASCMISCIRSWFSFEKCLRKENLDDFPTDYFQLAAVLKVIFSADLCKTFEKHCLAFDAMVKQKGSLARLFRGRHASRLAVSSAMISEQTFTHWIDMLCKAVAGHCFRLAAAQFGDQVDPRTMQPQEALDSSNDAHHRYDAKIVAKGGPFAQIILQGPDLVTAWKRCRVTDDDFENSKSPGDDACSFPVYYATAAHLDKLGHGTSLGMVLLPRRGLSAREPVNSITPRGCSIRLEQTTFGPFRSFLSAVFAAEVIGKTPSWNGNRHWKSGTNEYEGVMIFQFDMRQPHCHGDRSHANSEGQEAARTAVARRRAKPSRCWGMFARIHGQRFGTAWPTAGCEKDLALDALAGG